MRAPRVPLLRTAGLTAVLALATALAGLPLAGPSLAGSAPAAAPAAGLSPAAAGIVTTRLAGADRYATAATIAVASFPTGAATVVLASGERFPETLSASYLAGRRGAPLLLTEADRLPAATEAALATLGATDVVLTGGAAVLTPTVAARLGTLGYRVTRVGGLDRYETARLLAQAVPATSVGTLGGTGPVALLVSGEGFVDGLAAAAVSYAEAVPLLLTPRATLSTEAAAALVSLQISRVLLLGGPDAVSPAVVTALEQRGVTVTRLAGADRAATAAALADFAIGTLGWPATRVTLARGDGYADALAGAPYQGGLRAPLLLTTSPTELGAVTTGWLAGRSATVAALDVFGGPAAVSDATVTAAREAATPAS